MLPTGRQQDCSSLQAFGFGFKNNFTGLFRTLHDSRQLSAEAGILGKWKRSRLVASPLAAAR